MGTRLHVIISEFQKNMQYDEASDVWRRQEGDFQNGQGILRSVNGKGSTVVASCDMMRRNYEIGVLTSSVIRAI
jgi:hypothetical protein